MLFYKVNYSRLLAGGQRINITNIVINSDDLKIMINDNKSEFKYIVQSAVLSTEEELNKRYQDIQIEYMNYIAVVGKTKEQAEKILKTSLAD